MHIIDFDRAASRFGSRALHIRYLRRFQEDPSYGALQDALHAGDLPGAYLAAHALKGLSAQLGLSELHAAAAGLCAVLRADLAPSPALVLALEEAYARALHAVSLL